MPHLKIVIRSLQVTPLASHAEAPVPGRGRQASQAASVQQGPSNTGPAVPPLATSVQQRLDAAGTSTHVSSSASASGSHPQPVAAVCVPAPPVGLGAQTVEHSRASWGLTQTSPSAALPTTPVYGGLSAASPEPGRTPPECRQMMRELEGAAQGGGAGSGGERPRRGPSHAWLAQDGGVGSAGPNTTKGFEDARSAGCLASWLCRL